MKKAIVFAGLALSLISCQSQPRPDAADKLREAGRFEEARAAYDIFLKEHPESPLALSGRGITLLNLGNTDEALADLNKAVDASESPAFRNAKDSTEVKGGAYFYRGLARYVKGDFPASRSDYSRALLTGYKKVECLTQRGIVWAAEDQPGKAIEDFTRALELSPDDTVAISQRAYVRALVGDNSRAIQDYEKLLSLTPRDKAAWLNKGYTYITMGKNNEALTAIGQALAIDPDYLGAVMYKGIALFNLGNFEEALKEFNYCEKSDPGQPKLRYYRGETLVAMGRISEGCADLQYAVENGVYDGENTRKKYCR